MCLLDCEEDGLDTERFAVVACWWTRLIVESTDTRQSKSPSVSAWACRAARIWSQVPSSD